MADDIFADLVGIKPTTGSSLAVQNGSGLAGEDSVLPSPASGQGTPSHLMNLAGYGQAPSGSRLLTSEASGTNVRPEGRAGDPAIEKAFATVLERFAKGLQQALEDTNRCAFPQLLSSGCRIRSCRQRGTL